VIECFDISHIQGSDTVASMVVFVDGAAGCAVLQVALPLVQEVLGRRVRRRSPAGRRSEIRQGSAEGGEGGTWALPDLMVIDGGKGQLGRVLTMLPTSG
jgi:excinuclease ABC subunit C